MQGRKRCFFCTVVKMQNPWTLSEPKSSGTKASLTRLPYNLRLSSFCLEISLIQFFFCIWLGWGLAWTPRSGVGKSGTTGTILYILTCHQHHRNCWEWFGARAEEIAVVLGAHAENIALVAHLRARNARGLAVRTARSLETMMTSAMMSFTTCSKDSTREGDAHITQHVSATQSFYQS